MFAHAVESVSPADPAVGVEASLVRAAKAATATLNLGAGGDSGKHAGRDLEPEWAAAIDAATD